MKRLIVFFTIAICLIFTGDVFADKLVTTQSGVPYYLVFDEDAMGSDSAIGVPTQQSAKAYIDAALVTAKAYTDTEVAPKVEYVTGEIANISAAASTWAISPVAGTITKIWTELEGGAITGADAAITFKISTVLVTGGAITIAYDGSAAGDVDTCSPTAARTVTAGQAIEILTDGGSTGARKANVLIEITPSATTTAGWKKYIRGEIVDISAASVSTWVVAPVAGTITKIYSVIDGAITVGDAVLTFELDETAITGATITIANGSSAAGDVDSCVPSALNVVTAGQAIEIVPDGGSTDAAGAVIFFEITP